MPLGKVSVKPTWLMAMLELLITSMVNSDGTPPVTITGLNDLLMLIEAVAAARLALTAAELNGPSALLMPPTGTALLHGPVPLVFTSKAKSQPEPADKVAPKSCALVAPGLATRVGEPAQEVVALAGLATLRPAEKLLSLIARPVSSALELLMARRVTRALPPEVTEVGLKLLLPDRLVVMVRLADTLAGIVPALEEKSAGLMVFVYGPSVVPVTRTVITHSVCRLDVGRAFTVPPIRITWSSPGKACSDPPQVLVAAGLAASVRPAGRVSVRATAVRVEVVRLRTRRVSVEVPPWAILVGEKLLPTATKSTVVTLTAGLAFGLVTVVLAPGPSPFPVMLFAGI